MAGQNRKDGTFMNRIMLLNFLLLLVFGPLTAYIFFIWFRKVTFNLLTYLFPKKEVVVSIKSDQGIIHRTFTINNSDELADAILEKRIIQDENRK